MGRFTSLLGRTDPATDITRRQEAAAEDDDMLSTFDESLLSKDQEKQTYQIAFDAALSTNLVIKQVIGNNPELLYWIETAAWKKEPDLVFHLGGKGGPVVGSAVLRKRNHTMTLKLGGSGTLNDHQRAEELATINQDKKWRDGAYTLAIPTTSGEPRLYHFTRTQSTKDGVKGILGKLAFYNWLITNVRRGRVGLWLENTRGAISLTTGTLTVNADAMDQEDDLTFILYGLVAITERTRRDIQLTNQLTTAA